MKNRLEKKAVQFELGIQYTLLIFIPTSCDMVKKPTTITKTMWVRAWSESPFNFLKLFLNKHPLQYIITKPVFAESEYLCTFSLSVPRGFTATRRSRDHLGPRVCCRGTSAINPSPATGPSRATLCFPPASRGYAQSQCRRARPHSHGFVSSGPVTVQTASNK